MAGTSLLALLDDIASFLDDVATMTKIAASKTVGVIGDDLALSAQQVSGVRAERELPIVLAVAKGSMINKVILVPAALIISAVIPWAVIPLLMVGGVFLCFEGFEKLANKFLHKKEDIQQNHTAKIKAILDSNIDLVAFEKEKIKGAIRTDLVLSSEIIVMSLGIVRDAPFFTRVMVMSGVALLMTIVVYGIVAGIVKFDDAGIHLLKEPPSDRWHRFKRFVGRSILKVAPYLMKALSFVGTAAMFIVGGGILLHGFSFLEHILHHIETWVHGIPFIGGILETLAPILVNLIAGIIAGGITLAFVTFITRFIKKFKKKK